MSSFLKLRDPARRPADGFSLIEILITVALLSFIILGLFSVFNQTQRLFRSTMNQSDTEEAGRAASDILARELEQIAPAYGRSTNFAATLINDIPLVQNLPGPQPSPGGGRTNLLQDVFFLIRDNRNWVGIGYCVRTNDSQGRLWLPEISPGNPGQARAGYLYRYSYTLPFLSTGLTPGVPQDPTLLYNYFLTAAQPGSALISNRVCDSVVHFKFRAFDTNGLVIAQNMLTNRVNISVGYNGALAPGEVYQYYFYSNAVPAFIEMELGLLEPRSFARFNSIGDPTARLAYIKRDDVTARVQLFRQRIPIRTVDPVAYQ